VKFRSDTEFQFSPFSYKTYSGMDLVFIILIFCYSSWQGSKEAFIGSRGAAGGFLFFFIILAVLGGIYCTFRRFKFKPIFSFLGLILSVIILIVLVSIGITIYFIARHGFPSKRASARTFETSVVGLTLRSSRTTPALPFALSHHFAISAPLVISVQVRPLSFIR